MSENAEIERRGRAVLVLAGGLLLLLAFASRLHAEDPVGLDAQGVDVAAAFRGDLDVRDAHNRPVSWQLVERQLSGVAAASDRGAELSRLPLAKAVWHLLSRLVWGLALRDGLPGPTGPSEVALRLPAPKAALPAGAIGVLALACVSIWPRKPRAVPAYAVTRPLVLRC